MSCIIQGCVVLCCVVCGGWGSGGCIPDGTLPKSKKSLDSAARSWGGFLCCSAAEKSNKWVQLHGGLLSCTDQNLNNAFVGNLHFWLKIEKELSGRDERFCSSTDFGRRKNLFECPIAENSFFFLFQTIGPSVMAVSVAVVQQTESETDNTPQQSGLRWSVSPVFVLGESCCVLNWAALGLCLFYLFPLCVSEPSRPWWLSFCSLTPTRQCCFIWSVYEWPFCSDPSQSLIDLLLKVM